MRLLRWIDRHLEESVCCTALVVIFVCVFAQVVARYVFGVALRWSEETAAIAMVWAVYTGAALCVRERFHIRIVVCVKLLPEAFGKWVIVLADILFAAFCVLMIRVGWDFLAVAWRFPSTSPSLGINQFWPQTIVVIGYALMLARILQLYWHWWRDGAEGLPGMLDEDGMTAAEANVEGEAR